MPYTEGSGVVVRLPRDAPVNAEIVKRVPGLDSDNYVVRVRRRMMTVSDRDIVGPVPRLTRTGASA